MATFIEKLHLNDGLVSDAIVEKISSVILSCTHRMNVIKKSNFYDENDFVQEVWVRLLSDDSNILKKYDAARGVGLEYYILMIAGREIKNLLKKENAVKRGRRQNVELNENDIDVLIGTVPEPILEARDTITKLDGRLRGGLSQRGIDVLQSSFYKDEEPMETAIRLGITLQMVYNWQHKIRTLSRGLEKQLI